MAAAAAEVKDAATTKEIPKTSLANRGSRPDDVTVKFRVWTAHGNTAYQKGQFAGFPIAIAEQLERAGRVIIDPGYQRVPVSERMVRK